MSEPSSAHNFRRLAAALTAVLGLFTASPLAAQTGYQKPPKEILDILKAPPTPSVPVSPDAQHWRCCCRVSPPRASPRCPSRCCAWRACGSTRPPTVHTCRRASRA